MMEEADRIARPATTRRSLDRTCSQRKGILPRLGPNVFWWGNDHASRNAVVDVALALNPGPGVNGVCRRHVSRGCLQRTQIAADPATTVELQQRQTADLPVARRRAPRARLSRGCQPLRHARHGEPRGDPHQQGRYSHVEGLFLAARYQRVLCLQCKMVARLAILRLRYVVVRRPFALVVSDYGV